jgi:hypothetical protein
MNVRPRANEAELRLDEPAGEDVVFGGAAAPKLEEADLEAAMLAGAAAPMNFQAAGKVRFRADANLFGLSLSRRGLGFWVLDF